MIMITEQMILENQAKRAEITRKLETGESLDIEEVWMLGEQLELDDVSKYAGCADMYYRRLYTPWMEGMDLFGKPLTKVHELNFELLVRSWSMHLDAGYPAGSLGAASQKEMKKELKKMEGEWTRDPGVTPEQKDEKCFLLLAWSKLRYVLTRRIFDLDIKGEYYAMNLNGKEFRFDYESALHILTRHYAHGMKPHHSEKDHFYGVFAYNELHLEFEKIFTAIDKSGYYVNENLEEITFRFKGVIYRMYAHPVNYEETVFRISTFFPVSNAGILDKLQKEFHEEVLNDELAIFIRNAQ